MFGLAGLPLHTKHEITMVPIYGWCSWYDRTTKIDEAHVLDVVDTIEKIPTPLERELYRLMMDIKLWMVHGMQMLSFHPGCLGLRIESAKRV